MNFLKGPSSELHIDTGRPLLRVARREMLLDSLEVDVDLRFHAGLVLTANLDAAAPGQEIGVVGDIGDEVEHLFRRMADQHGFLDICHKGRNTWQEWEASRPLHQTLSGGFGPVDAALLKSGF